MGRPGFIEIMKVAQSLLIVTKVPQKQFEKQLLSIDIKKYSKYNPFNSIDKPEVKLFYGRRCQSSKKFFASTVAFGALRLQASAFNYFPSYEIMMDELRDYRFYADDMLHPSQLAIDYIWKFKETNISETALSIMEEVEMIQKFVS
jgi:hypothetical protein